MKKKITLTKFRCTNCNSPKTKLLIYKNITDVGKVVCLQCNTTFLCKVWIEVISRKIGTKSNKVQD